jgi:hypothetical protein
MKKLVLPRKEYQVMALKARREEEELLLPKKLLLIKQSHLQNQNKLVEQKVLQRDVVAKARAPPLLVLLWLLLQSLLSN